MRNRIEKILITNSVAINGGDEALLRVTMEAFKSKLSNCSFIVLTNNPKDCSRYLPDIIFDYDWEYVLNKYPPGLINKIKSKIRNRLQRHFKVSYLNFFSRFFAGENEKKIYNYYRDADVILSSAGGYIHDIYGYDGRILGYQLAIFLKKDFFFFGQSLGPFFNYVNHDAIVSVLNNSKGIFLREQLSRLHVERIGVMNKNIFVTTDMAFAWHRLMPGSYKHRVSQQPKNIVMNFRKWKDEETNTLIKQKARELILHLITKYKFNITFLSTCQGIDGYVDDSLFAEELCLDLPEHIVNGISFNRRKLPFHQLLTELSQFDMYVGMRLHGTIMSMLSGVPALNIAYEHKTAGIFSTIDYNDSFIDYTETADEWKNKTDDFITNYKGCIGGLKGKLSKGADLALQNVDIVLELMN